MTVVSISGITIGLLISSIPKLTSKAAQNIIPLILVPQIIFGGFIVDFEDMNKVLFFNEKAKIPEICQLMPSRWGFEAVCIMQDTKNSFHSKNDALQSDFDSLVSNEDEIKDKSGRDEFSKRKAEFLSELNIFRNKFKTSYGNGELNKRMKESMEKFEIYLSEDNELKQLGKDELNIIYPMFVKEKKIPFTNIIVKTHIYNVIMLTLYSILLGALSILLLVYREKAADLFMKIKFGNRKIE